MSLLEIRDLGVTFRVGEQRGAQDQRLERLARTRRRGCGQCTQRGGRVVVGQATHNPRVRRWGQCQIVVRGAARGGGADGEQGQDNRPETCVRCGTDRKHPSHRG